MGAEVAVGSFLVGNLMLPESLGASQQDAGKLIPIYWGLAMLGRFAGSAVLRVVSPAWVLAFNALGAGALIIVSIATTGTVSGYALLGVGLMNSIMFPVIFTLASEGLGRRAADGSGIINVAIVGGAVVPALYGWMADQSGLRAALILPVLCYAVIAAYGLFARRPVAALA